jgi:hypothetical protein
MRVLAPVLLLTVLAPAAQEPSSAPPAAKAPNPEQTASPPQEKTITLNAGVKVVLAMVGPVWSKSAKPGDTVRAVSAFPVTIGNAIAIPPGTFVEGIIDALTRPTWRTKRADFQMHFTKLIFVNGYTVDLPDAPQGAATARPANSLAGPTATASVRVDVSYASDILLDNGSQFEMGGATPHLAGCEASFRGCAPHQTASDRSISIRDPLPPNSRVAWNLRHRHTGHARYTGYTADSYTRRGTWHAGHRHTGYATDPRYTHNSYPRFSGHSGNCVPRAANCRERFEGFRERQQSCWQLRVVPACRRGREETASWNLSSCVARRGARSTGKHQPERKAGCERAGPGRKPATDRDGRRTATSD